MICTPAYARYPFTAGWTGGGGGRQGKKIGQYPSASGGARTHDPWIMSPMHKPLHYQAPHPHTYIHTYTSVTVWTVRLTHIHTYTSVTVWTVRLTHIHTYTSVTVWTVRLTHIHTYIHTPVQCDCMDNKIHTYTSVTVWTVILTFFSALISYHCRG